jgi:pyruvate,water dikinase
MGKEELIESGYVKWFSELSNKDVAIAGGKGASLAEMYNAKFPIPPGFMVTAQAYSHFMKATGCDSQIVHILNKLDIEDTKALANASIKIREIIDNSQMPKDLEKEILEAYDILDAHRETMHNAKAGALDILKNSHEPPFVAVRSSATTEDLADASFAGQQDSFLGVKGNKDLIQKVKECFSSLFTARAIYYRQKKGFDHTKARLAVVVQKMINSQKSGVIFSKNPVKDDGNTVVDAVWGLGEGIVSGKIVPDHYVVNAESEIVEMQVPEKKIALVRTSSGRIDTVTLTKERSEQQVLTGYEIKRLAQYARQLEEHYGKPQDIEFAVDGEIYIVQSRPITTTVKKQGGEITGDVLLSGLGASPGVGSGIVRIVHSLDDLAKVKHGDVMVTTMTNPDMVVSMQRAAGIVTDEGGVTSHAAIVSREIGIPCVVGTRTATHVLKDGQLITVDGFTGRVLDGKAEEKKAEIKHIVPTRTKIKVIVDLPDYASRAALSGSQSVGLVRLEGIIGASGKHPVWFVKNDAMKEYIHTVSSGLKKIALPFEELWIRTSDIRSDEYLHLEGAPQKTEGNPMLGDHGIRFSLKNIDILEAELAAVKEIADEFPDKTFGIMMPQIISVEEVRQTKKLAQGLKMPNNTKMGIMVETPAAVQIIEDICHEGISFMSFGTNDLTQYTLAIDRNNPDVQDLYSEMHPAVLRSISQVIQTCKHYGVETSICGQAGSHEDMAAFLVKEGIDSISCNADAAYNVSVLVARLENDYAITTSVKKEPSQEKSTVGVGMEQLVAIPMMKNSSEEDLILRALEDDYVPAIGQNSDVPALNDAITVDSEQFEGLKEDKVVTIF